MKTVNAEKALGILLEVHGKIDTTGHDKRREKTKDVISMISMLQIPVENEAELVCLKTAGARYGLEITQPCSEVAKAFDARIMNVIGGNNGNRCRETTMALLCPSHNILIQTATPYQMLVTASRQIARHPSIQNMLI